MTRDYEADIATTAQQAATEARQDKARSTDSSPPPSQASETRQHVLLGVLMIALLAITALNVVGGGLFGMKAPKQTPRQEETSRAAAQDLQRTWVEAYREESGQLPSAREAAAGPWNFVDVDGKDYELVFSDGNEKLVHSSPDAGHGPVAERTLGENPQ